MLLVKVYPSSLNMWVFPKIGVPKKWMVYNGKTLLKWMIWEETHYLLETAMCQRITSLIPGATPGALAQRCVAEWLEKTWVSMRKPIWGGRNLTSNNMSINLRSLKCSVVFQLPSKQILVKSNGWVFYFARGPQTLTFLKGTVPLHILLIRN